MRIWYSKVGDTRPSIITADTCSRPDEICIEAPNGDMNPDHYITEWNGSDPVVTKEAGWEVDDLRRGREHMRRMIKAERDRRMAGGYKVEIEPGVYKWYHSDQTSRTQHLGLIIAGAAVPPVPWKTMDGTKVPMSQTIAQKVFQAAMVLDDALYTKAEEHMAAMEASSDPLSYNFLTGWPEHFHEI